MLDKKTASDVLAILTEELIPAMGCTEPISLAFASARAREVLGSLPESITAYCSGKMIKNVRCVTIPNSGGMTGIETACALGAFGGDATRVMEVLEAVTPETREAAKHFMSEGRCGVEYLDSEIPLHFIIEMKAGTNSVLVEVRYSHINIVRIIRNGEDVYRSDVVIEEAAVGDDSIGIEGLDAGLGGEG